MSNAPYYSSSNSTITNGDDTNTNLSTVTVSTTVSTSSTISHGGYDYELLGDTEHSKFECPICLFLMRDPVITACGHRFCSYCIAQWMLNQSNSNGCPVDGGILNSEDIFPDNFTKREILSLKAKCPYLKSGCSAIVCLAEMEKHLLDHLLGASTFNRITTGNSPSTPTSKECKYRHLGCTKTFPPDLLQRHLESDSHYHLMLLESAYGRMKGILRPTGSVDSPYPPDFSRQDSRDSTRPLLWEDGDDMYDFQRDEFRRSLDSVRSRWYNNPARHHPRLAESDESLSKPVSTSKRFNLM